jgi:magnesium transporter
MSEGARVARLLTGAAAVFRKQHPPPGARPGTLAIPASSPPPTIHLYQYSRDELAERTLAAVEDLAGCLRPDRTTWIDVRGLGDEAVLRRIGAIFSLHPLALEDAVNVPQRAKSEPYAAHHLVIARMPVPQEGGGIDVPQVALFIGRDHLLTFQERSFGFFDPVRERLRAGTGPMRGAGPDYLAYALLDTLVDRHYPIVETLARELEDIEDEVIEDPAPDTLARIHRNRRQLVVLRRVGRPQREAVRELLAQPSPFVGDEVRLYLRDTHDHIAQVMELVDSSHEMSVGLMEIYLSNVSHRTNEVMKVLTLMASVFIPLTFVAGIYGMNFEFMPELRSRWAYPLVLAVMLGLAAGMVAYFRHRGWIGRVRGRRRAPPPPAG